MFKQVSFKKNIKSSLAAVAVLFTRVLPLKFSFGPNVSFVGSLGFHSHQPLAFLISVVLFDLIKGGFYPGFWLTYLGFGGYYLLGHLAQESWRRKIFLLPLASFLFFLISNFGVWLYWYQPTMTGLVKCYTLALPFYKNTLIGDLVFGYGYLLLSLVIKHLAKFNLLASLRLAKD